MEADKRLYVAAQHAEEAGMRDMARCMALRQDIDTVGSVDALGELDTAVDVQSHNRKVVVLLDYRYMVGSSDIEALGSMGYSYYSHQDNMVAGSSSGFHPELLHTDLELAVHYMEPAKSVAIVQGPDCHHYTAGLAVVSPEEDTAYLDSVCGPL